MGHSKESESAGQPQLIPDLLRVVADKGAAEILVDSGEAILDNALSSGLIDGVSQSGALEDVPVLGILVKVAKIGIGVRDHIFMKNLIRFIRALDSISLEERARFQEHLKTDPDFREKVGTKLLTLLARIDDVAKPALIAKAFAAYLGQHVDYEQFERMAGGIDRALMPDLRKLATVTNSSIEEHWGANLIPAGLTTFSMIDTTGVTFVEYPLTAAGDLVQRFCLREQDNERK